MFRDNRATYEQVAQAARNRFAQVEQTYLEEVPMAETLSLDFDTAVLLTNQEYQSLPEEARLFFDSGNKLKRKSDKTSLRGERFIFLDGYYSGGPSELKKADYFLESVSVFKETALIAHESLNIENPVHWRARLAVWDNLVGLAVSQFHALEALRLLNNQEMDPTFENSKRAMEAAFEGYYLTLCGKPAEDMDLSIDEILEISEVGITQKYDQLKQHSQYDLFRTEREVMGAPALAAAYSWAKEGKFKGKKVAIGILFGGIDELEAIKFIRKYADEFEIDLESLPQEFAYLLPKVTQIGKTSRSMGERSGSSVMPLFDAQIDLIKDLNTLPSEIVVVDDSISTGTSTLVALAFIKEHLGIMEANAQISYLSTKIGYRWAQADDKNDVASAEFLNYAGAIAVSPTTRVFRKKYSGVETMLFREITSRKIAQSLELNPSQLLERLDELARWDAVDGVGFDIYSTLLETPGFNAAEKREKVAQQSVKILQQAGIEDVSWENYQNVYRHFRREIEAEVRRIHSDRDFSVHDVHLNIASYFGITQKETVANKLDRVMLDQELQDMQVIPGMKSVVEKAIKLFGREKVGIFSNTYYSKEHIIELLRWNGLVSESLLTSNNILVSSEIGWMKPAVQSFESLSSILGVDTRKLLFIGDTKGTDQIGARRAKAVPVLLKME